MKTYVGTRNPDGLCTVLITYAGTGRARPLSPRLDLSNHSPTGFEWGYGGSGPAQLALALLADVIEDREALALHQAYKFRVVAYLPRAGFTLTEEDVKRAVRELQISGRR